MHFRILARCAHRSSACWHAPQGSRPHPLHHFRVESNPIGRRWAFSPRGTTSKYLPRIRCTAATTKPGGNKATRLRRLSRLMLRLNLSACGMFPFSTWHRAWNLPYCAVQGYSLLCGDSASHSPFYGFQYFHPVLPTCHLAGRTPGKIQGQPLSSWARRR